MECRLLFFVLFVPLNFILLYYVHQYSYEYTKSPTIVVQHRNDKIHKRILVYTSFFGRKPWPMANATENYTERCGCDFDGCEITYDQSKLDQSDIVLFHGRNMPNLKEVNKKRPLNQLWLYFIMENAFHSPDVGPIDRYFNLTSSYRFNSNIRYPYRYHMRIPPSEVKKVQPVVNYAKGKTKQIAWGVSNCGKQREKLAERLHEFGLQIDNFGKCKYSFANSRPSPREKSPYHEYKFFFAAENRFCEEYVTEKYWWYGLVDNVNTIPIVVGGSNYSNPKYAIPGSYIDAFKFSSPKKLAEYLLLLDQNDTLYNQYFKWKQYWTFYDLKHPEFCDPFVCEICWKLKTNSWKMRDKPLISTINADKECNQAENYFRNWVKRV